MRELSRPAAARWLLPCVVDWALIAATFAGAAWVDHWAVYALAVIPLGSRQQALGALFHDASHGLVSRQRGLNDFLGSLLSAWPLGLSLGGYRRYHFAHHRLLGTDQDPEIAHKRALPQWVLPAAPSRVARDFSSDLVGGGLPHLLAAGGLTRPVAVGEALGLGAFWAAVLLVFFWLHALWIPVLWVISIATVFWSGVRLRIWTEHLGTRDTHRISVPAWLGHLIMPHNIGLHWEHHHWPGVPFWNLARLRALMPPGSPGAPPVLPLSRLLGAFARSAPLASGQVGVTIQPDASTPPDVTREAAPASLDEPRALGFFLHVGLPLAAGALVYVACRSALPRALAWLPVSGWLVGRLPGRFVDVFPDAAWSYALTAFFMLLWADAPGGARLFWVALSFAVSAGWELGQLNHLTPGTFDVFDLTFGVAGCALAVVSCSSSSKGTRPCASTNVT